MIITLTCPNCGKDRSYRKLPIVECPHCRTRYPEEVLRTGLQKLTPRSIHWPANLTILGLAAATLFLAMGFVDVVRDPEAYFDQPSEQVQVSQNYSPSTERATTSSTSTFRFIPGFGVMLLGLLMLMSPLFFIIWFYLAYRNLERAGFDDLEYSPWAPLWVFFVPFLNLFRPYQIMQELWQGSQAVARGEYTGQAWKEQGNSWLVTSWWGTFLMAGVLLAIASPELFGVAVARALIVVGYLFIVAAGMLAVLMVRTISDLQETGRVVDLVGTAS